MIPFVRPTLPAPEEWLPHLQPAYDGRWFSNFGPVASRLEDELTAKYATGNRRAALVSSCTAGLATALLAMRIRGRVAMPSFTFPATAQAVLLAGCEPVFCDVSPTTWELDPPKLDECVRRHAPAAIVHVRSFGFCHDVSPIEEVARRHRLPLIIDAAAAFGGALADRRWVGGQGEMEVFSLHATKVFGIGEGGVIFAPADRISALRRACNFGIEDGDVRSRALNAKLSEIHAAIGMAVLARIDAFIARRRTVAEAYVRAFAPSELIAPPPAGGLPPMQTFPMLTRDEAIADAVVANCHAEGVEIRRYYRPALHRTRLFSSAVHEKLPVSTTLAARTLCLPIYSDMTRDESNRVIAVVQTALSRA
ncbi:MAG TPA: DegT/DnrJ/EryC1/StrS family aminotransferase [Candidatus Binatia bacterium]|nr:DegT/DnrJ/EryC1/StrS family aminotransferase [Candidatus Binatia bacterium]